MSERAANADEGGGARALPTGERAERMTPWWERPGLGDAAACGHPNPVWFTDSQLWNEVMNGGDRDEEAAGIVCPACFASTAAEYFARPESRWRVTGWRLVPEWGRPESSVGAVLAGRPTGADAHQEPRKDEPQGSDESVSAPTVAPASDYLCWCDGTACSNRTDHPLTVCRECALAGHRPLPSRGMDPEVCR